MRLFRIPKRNPRYTEDETPWQRFFRYVLIALIFCAVVWGFWLSNERRVEMMKKPSAPRIDSTGTLSDEQQSALASYADTFQEVYGITLVLTVSNEPLPDGLLQARDRPGTMLLGLSPKNNQVLLETPPLIEAALGQLTVSYLRYVHFVPHFAGNSWPRGLESALNLITDRLDAAIAPAKTARL